MWAGLELNLIRFIPFLFLGRKTYREASLVYFLTQACGSFILLIRGVRLVNTREVFIMLIIGAMLLKIGAAPLHFWYPKVSIEVN